MLTVTHILILGTILLLTSCGGKEESATSKPAPPQATETKAIPVAVDNSHENVSTGTSEVSKTLTIAGNTFNVLVKGSITPNAVLDVSIVQSSGAPAAAIRVWVGDESGVGSLKVRVHSHGASSHAHAKAPAKLPQNSALWIEVQNTDGTSGSGSIQVN